jgi:hypothetical protein
VVFDAFSVIALPLRARRRQHRLADRAISITAIMPAAARHPNGLAADQLLPGFLPSSQ